MEDKDVYRRLAQRLDTLPNGFPATESGVELNLLAKLFTPPEAALASQMGLRYAPAKEIANKAGVDSAEARRTLKDMARKGLIRVRRGEGQLIFALLPFVVGFYEEQLPRLDAELAELTEQYFQEIGGRTILDTSPPIHRVIPVGEAIPFDLEIFTHESAAAIVESAKSWGVRDCICRVQQELIGNECEYPVEVCLVMAPVEGAFQGDGPTRPLTKEEALEVLREAEEAGLVHSTGNFRDQHFYICNCCPCCCGVLRGLTEYGVPTAVARSAFRSTVDADLCIGCEDCVDRCPVGALSVDEVCTVDRTRCLGCGVCVSVCPTGALSMERLPDDQVEPPPANLKEWGMRRAQARGIALE